MFKATQLVGTELKLESRSTNSEEAMWQSKSNPHFPLIFLENIFREVFGQEIPIFEPPAPLLTCRHT